MTTAIIAVASFLAALGAAAVGASLSRRNEQKQWLRDECKRVYLEFLTAAAGCESVLKQYYDGGNNDPLFWRMNHGTPRARTLGGWPERQRLDRAREETEIFGETSVIAAQGRLYDLIDHGFAAQSLDDETRGRHYLVSLRASLDLFDGAVTQYKESVRKSFGR